jgi:hypothetical protein
LPLPQRKLSVFCKALVLCWLASPPLTVNPTKHRF